jgi:prophage regulatory protein
MAMLFPDGPGTLQKGPHMAHYAPSTLAILRRKQVQAETGYSRSTIYLRITQGLWPKPVSLGARAVGWPAAEVAALNAARIAGQPDEEIRALVARLEADRTAPCGSR